MLAFEADVAINVYKKAIFLPLTQRRIKMKGEIYSQNLQPSDAARSWEMNEKAVCRFRAAILVFPLRLPSVSVYARVFILLVCFSSLLTSFVAFWSALCFTLRI